MTTMNQIQPRPQTYLPNQDQDLDIFKQYLPDDEEILQVQEEAVKVLH